MTRHIPVQEQTFQVVVILRGTAKAVSFDVIAHNAREALEKAMIPENMQRVRSELGDGELVWEVVEDFI